jgi:peroxiredoxin
MALSHMVLASLLAVSLQYTNDMTAAAENTSTTAPTETAHPVALVTGRTAPDFVFRSHEYGWRKLGDVLDQGSVLLVFGGSDEQLRSVQDSYQPLIEAGVVPMVVTSVHSDDARKAIERCQVRYSVLSDPHDEIATQFGLATREFQGWYLIDSKGHVRGHGMGTVPVQSWAAVATSALGNDSQALSEE